MKRAKAIASMILLAVPCPGGGSRYRDQAILAERDAIAGSAIKASAIGKEACVGGIVTESGLQCGYDRLGGGIVLAIDEALGFLCKRKGSNGSLPKSH